MQRGMGACRCLAQRGDAGQIAARIAVEEIARVCAAKDFRIVEGLKRSTHENVYLDIRIPWAAVAPEENA